MAASVFECLDGHTCGNPVRLVAKGGPHLIGNDMSEKRQYFMQHYDWIRKGLMYEPRGHDMMSGSILYPPHDKENDVAVLFIETSGCLPMCGHGTIGTITMAIENDLITPKVKGQVRLETPAGLVIIAYHRPEHKVEWVRLTNVKSYLAAEALEIDSPHLGPVTFDVAYGGNFYAIIDPQTNFGGLQHHTAAELIQYSQKLRDLINGRYPDRFIHPENDTINGVSHMLWTGSVLDERSSGRNAVFYGDKAIDRSPCGTGTSARMAQLHAKGLLRPKEAYVHESYIGSTFIGRVEETTTIGNRPAIIPSVQGWAKAYGRNTITIDPEDDPFAYGFQVI
ncbi:MAG: 4-hydroxyproline epimerase [Flavobacteriaceae bacterium]|nr:4-hydroxyproline epimerase [Flavobacteriaceae bacterium]